MLFSLIPECNMISWKHSWWQKDKTESVKHVFLFKHTPNREKQDEVLILEEQSDLCCWLLTKRKESLSIFAFLLVSTYHLGISKFPNSIGSGDFMPFILYMNITPSIQSWGLIMISAFSSRSIACLKLYNRSWNKFIFTLWS